MLSYLDTFRLMGAIFLLMLPLLLVMRRPRRRGPVAMH